MSVTSGFFDSKNKDRLYNTEQLSSIFDGIIKDGVYMGYEDAFIVKATDPASLTVNVGPGRAWFHHTWTHNDAPLPIVVKQGDVVLNRIDSIIIDIDKTEDVRSNKVTYLEGSPSSEPTAPVLVNEEKHWQIPLCNISMPAGSTTITQAQITNRIGTSDCPFVTGIIETIDTDELLAQWNAEYREWYERVQQEIDQWTEQEQEDFTNWMNGRKTEFDEWFAGIQDILDGDVAGNLLNRINHRTGINATATYSAGVVAITAPDDAGEILTFVAPSDFLSSDTYTLNGEALTITDLNGEALDEAWKKNSPITITVSGGKAFFKAGGSGKNDTLPPLLGNMTVEVVEGDENDTYTIKMDKLVLDKTTKMVGGAQLEWGEEMPAKPGKGTGGIKTWTREEIITTGKPYDGLYLGDVTPSDAITETLIYLPENDSGSVKLVPFLVLSVDYLGGVYVMRQKGNKDWVGKYGNNVTYENSEADVWTKSYLNSILDKGIVEKLLECEIHVFEQGTIKRKCWIPSYGELYSDFTDSGNTFMPYFNSNGRRALTKQDDGNLLAYWTRTFYNLSSVRIVNPDGSGYFQSASNKTAAYRPAFVLPKDFKIQQRPDGSYTVYNDYGLITLKDIQASNNGVETIVNIPTTSGLNAVRYTMKTYNEQDVGLMEYRNSVGSSNYSPNKKSKLLFEASNLYSTLVSTMESTFSDSLKTLIPSVNVKLTRDSGSVEDVSLKYFILSLTEIGAELGNRKVEGTLVPWYADSTKKAARENGFTRTISMDSDYYTAYCTNTSGSTFVNPPDYAHTIWPVFCLPLTAPIRLLADGTYDLVPEDPALAQSISTTAEAGTPVQLKDIPVSTAGNKVTVKIPETGGEQEYITLRENYDGVSGGYALMRNNTAPGARFHATPDGGDKPYQNSELDTHVQNFADYLNESVRKYLVEGSVLIGVSGSQVTLKRSMFLPSAKEVGYTSASIYPEGTPFEYFNSDDSRKSDNDYWTRSKDMSSGSRSADYISLSQGSLSSASQTSIKPIRPIILVSGEAWFTDNGDGTYTFVGDEPASSEFVSHTVEVPHGQKVVFRQFTQNQKKQFQTMLVGGVYPPLGDVEPPFKLPEFTGNHMIYGDEIEGRIELLESGDLTLSPGVYDIFAVGGGSSGIFGGYKQGSSIWHRVGGGGSGYTKTLKGYVQERLAVLNVIIGAGGSVRTQTDNQANLGSATKILNALAEGIIEAPGGGKRNNSAAEAEAGQPGGSGGGSGGGDYNRGGNGGSDGSNGEAYGNIAAGQGQNTTTKAFEESSNTIYAGGGSGFNNSYRAPGGGGAGGGIDGQQQTARDGTTNTGSGGGAGYKNSKYNFSCGAGGSGIIIIRWKNA